MTWPGMFQPFITFGRSATILPGGLLYRLRHVGPKRGWHSRGPVCAVHNLGAQWPPRIHKKEPIRGGYGTARAVPVSEQAGIREAFPGPEDDVSAWGVGRAKAAWRRVERDNGARPGQSCLLGGYCFLPSAFRLQLGTSPLTAHARAFSTKGPSFRAPSRRWRSRASSCPRRSSGSETAYAPAGPAPLRNGSQ